MMRYPMMKMKNNILETKKTKVIFLTKYPEAGASSRYRVYQYLPYFKVFDFKSQALLSETSFKLMYRKGEVLKKVFFSLKDYIVRTLFIFINLDADVIYMQRELFAFGPLWAERMFKLLGKKLILDLDDALFINRINKNHPLKWDKASRVKNIIKRSDLVVAGNSWIRDECLKLGSKKAVHIDVAEVVRFNTLKRVKNLPMKVLWLGSPTTSKYLKLIEKPLRKIQDKVGLEINIVGGDPNEVYDFKSNCFSWSIETEAHYLQISDIGLMPLPMDNWSKGKCGGKARTYMASGLIPVVSNIGYNQDLIKHKRSGLLCNDLTDWFNCLLLLNDNFELQDTIRKLNFDYVKSSFDKNKIAKQIEKEIIKIV
jgi:glycosyltransferase involved in cell wall biosynthesis